MSQKELTLEQRFEKMMESAIKRFTSTLGEERREREQYTAERYMDLARRLQTMEQAGIPVLEFDQLKLLISRIQYAQRQQTKAIEGILQFFNITKRFFENEDSNSINEPQVST